MPYKLNICPIIIYIYIYVCVCVSSCWSFDVEWEFMWRRVVLGASGDLNWVQWTQFQQRVPLV